MSVDRRAVLRGAGAVYAAALMPRFLHGFEGPMTAPSAMTTLGPITGAMTAGQHLPIAVFKGIPYGADTRETRFLPPKAAASWTAPRACLAWGDRAPQQSVDRNREKGAAVNAGFASVEGGARHYHLPEDEGPQSENCLNLNVWTSQLSKSTKSKPLPVLVYFHGGAYNNGTVNAALYDGTRLASTGRAIVVTVNHRLNAFGFLYLGAMPGLEKQYAQSGNVSLLDLVLALEWVRDNAAAFGGDASRVTIFGQSGGGAKCATLMAMDRARGLFHRVLTMSGQQVTAPSAKLAGDRAETALAAMGVTGEVTAEKLNALTVEQIRVGSRTMNNWLPVRDGIVLKRDPFEPNSPPMSDIVPMILGNTKDEILGSTAWQKTGLTWETLPADMEKAIAPYKGKYTVDEIIKAYRGWYPGYTPVDVEIAAVAAFRSWPGQVIEAERRASSLVASEHTWVYQMNYPSPTADGRAPHTEDLAFVFDNVALSPGMVGASGAEMKAAQPLATEMSQMLLRYAESGDPNGGAMPKWPVYRLTSRDTMFFDKTTQVVSDPRGVERRMMVGARYRQPGT